MQKGRDRQTLEQAAKWALSEGWEPGLDDARSFAEIDPEGWFSARTADGQIVTTLSALKYDETYGFIGLYITDPEFRGQGFGSQVWALGREHLASCASVGLDGVLEREATYASDGFVRSHVTTRYAGRAGELANSIDELNVELPRDCMLVDVRKVGVQRLSQFELKHQLFPAPRGKFLATWLATNDSTALAVVATNDEILGWGMVRPSTTGWRIGPLFALDVHTAYALFGSLADAVPQSETLFIDVPDPNSAALRLVRDSGFAPIFGCVRMYAGRIPELDLVKIYANTSFEVG